MIFSQLSKTHYIPPLTAAEFGNANPENQYFYISTPSENNVSFTIKSVGLSTIDQYVVSKSSPQEIFIDFEYGQLFLPSYSSSQIINSRGFIIEAQEPIYVSVRMEAGEAQAGALVSKGVSALGYEFRVGTYTNENPSDNYLNFVSVMASEDNTTVGFDDISTSLVIKNYSGPIPINDITLDKGESYTIAINSDEAAANRDGLIGALVKSDKPIVVNCGSANGSFGGGSGRDYGIDQIVGADKIGNEYIFVRGFGTDEWENILLIAHFDNTSIDINGISTGINLNAGQYYIIEGNKFSSNENMYVKTSHDVFAYQGVGGLGNNGAPSEANQGLFFVPPLSCETRGNIDNIANIDEIGSVQYDGGVSIVTKIGATVTINNLPIASFNPDGPFTVPGNNLYETYKVTGLRGTTTSIECDDELYCAYFNYNGSATSGSFYSGFPTPPEINSQVEFDIKGVCLENGLELSVANPDSFDQFEWFFNDGNGFMSTGESGNTFIPTNPGIYKLMGTLNCTGNTFESAEVPIGHCPDDTDNDGIIDNIDIDNDNDGILNCTESFGDNPISLVNPVSGNLTKGSYIFKGTINPVGNNSNSIIGDADGNFKSDVSAKNGPVESSVTYTMDFNKDLNLLFKLPSSTPLGGGNLNNEQEFIIQVPNNKTITLLDPKDELLIYNDYKGEYESSITLFSSFKIRFKIKDTSLAPSDSEFEFVSSMIKSFSYTHVNLSETNNNTAIFKINATCLPLDSDNDGVNDEFDYDSDDDGIPDYIEVNGLNNILSRVDADTNGLDDIYSLTTLPIDTDLDKVDDYLDLDSDNDGVTDLIETGQLGLLSDTDLNGVVDIGGNFGNNGWVDVAETSPDSGVIEYTLDDLDTDSIYSYLDLDSDGDNCSDVIEAGFSDGNNDNYLGDNPFTVDINGLVNNANDGYTMPNSDYNTIGIITIIEEPEPQVSCELNSTVFEIETNSIDNYQWEVSIDNGVTWSSIVDDSIYQDSDTNKLTILDTPLSFDTYLYKVQLGTDGNSCGATSEDVLLTVNPLPDLDQSVDLIQCDDDANPIGYSAFNLYEANNKVSTDADSEKFTYYLSKNDAINKLDSISNPTNYINRIKDSDIVWVSVQSKFDCSSVSFINLIVTPSKIPTIINNSFYQCDDYLDQDGNDNENNNNRDGISTFDFSAADIELKSKLPAGQPIIVRYYKNEDNALSETDPITDISNYRNIGFQHQQVIYARLENELNNACLGLRGIITLTVEALPIANAVTTIMKQCDNDDDEQDGIFLFNTSTLESEILKNQNLADVRIDYFDVLGNPLKDSNGNLITSPFPTTFSSTSQTINYTLTNRFTNAPDGACTDSNTLEFIVDILPINNTVSIAPICDPNPDDGLLLGEFNTSTLESSIGTQPGMDITYFDATGVNPLLDINGNSIISPFPNSFVSGTQTITVIVTNPNNTNCPITNTIDFTVNPLPRFDVDLNPILCITEPASTILLEVYPNDKKEKYDYSWLTPNGNTSTSETLEATIGGVYTVTLTKTDGTNCSRTKEIVVENSEAAHIDLEDIIIVDDSKNNTISIITENNNLGIGDYEFSLDTDFSFQDEPFFDYVEAGVHTIFIRDKKGCTTSQIDVSVLAFPKFFTPNGDGENETWNIEGIDPKTYPTVSVHIFDRFGKLLRTFNPYSEEWDGRFNGELLPTTDYWYSIELTTNEKYKTRVEKGHFSLIR